MILVVIILVLFLMNVRTTFITLTAIPLSLVITALVFAISGMSINTMTLGGLAVALGELVDDAIVDVENIFRRLNENRHADKSKASAAGCVSGQHGSSQFDRLQHDHCVHRVHSAVCFDRHGRTPVRSAGSRLHRFDCGVTAGFADSDAGTVVHAAGTMQRLLNMPQTDFCCDF